MKLMHFRLPMDHHLQNAIKQAAKPLSTLIYMTATPPRHLLRQIPKHRIIQLPARFIDTHYQFQNLNILN